MASIIKIPDSSPSRLGDPPLRLKVKVLDVKLGHGPGAVLSAEKRAGVFCLVPLSEELLEDRGLETLHDTSDPGCLGQTIVSDELVRVGEHFNLLLLTRFLNLIDF